MIPWEKPSAVEVFSRHSLRVTILLLVAGMALSHFHNLHAQSFLWAKRVGGTVNDDNELSIGLAH